MSASSLSGRRLAGYDIGPLLGEGGMGEVYRARDSKLNREVAIKILLPAVATDADRLARFRREAQVLASLNHQNIAHIHGLEEGEAGPFLVMELVEGPTLADRIKQGPIPIDDALAIARQIADALEAAHERGIIHRDLKPANIKASDDGAVKVLDFGLAKALDPQTQEAASGANSPTITTPAMTLAGLILGTAAYMSPEQAKGRAVDKRSDVWAFGCVLYEMLTAKRAFDGEDVTETIAAIVRGEPDWNALPADTPPHIRLLLKRCLDKDRRARVSDIGVARFVMNEALPASSAAQAPAAAGRPGRTVALAAAGGLLAGALLAGGMWMMRLAPAAPASPLRFTLTPLSQPLLIQGTDHDVALAPDGSFIVYRSGENARGASRGSYLVVRSLNELEPRMLPGTNGARSPFISADGLWVGFSVGRELRKVAIAGGSAALICQVTGSPRGASWGDDGVIVFASTDANGLQRVPASGGEPKPLTTPDAATREVHSYPHVLPGSKSVLFTTLLGADFLSARVDAVDVATGARRTVLQGGHDAAYLNTGHLVYATTNQSPEAESRFRASLRAVRFDVTQVQIIGESVNVIEPITVTSTGAANYSVSRRGDLVFVPGGVATAAAAIAPPRRTLAWVTRKGQEIAIPAPPRSYALGRISPDGTRIAVDIREQTNDIWIWDLNRQTLTSLNRNPAQDMSPIWTPDGRRVIWTSNRAGSSPNLFWQAADGTGTPERLTSQAIAQFPTSITPDGGTIALFASSPSAGNGMDLFTVSLKEPDRQAKPLVATLGFDFDAEISPDGKWLAYHSNESGEFQVYVRPFPNVQDGRSQISTSGGTRAAWARNGRELFYLDNDGFLTSVPVQPSPGAAFAAGTPARILKTKYYLGSTILGLDLRAYDVSADGQRFLMIKDPDDQGGQTQLASMVVVVNWSEELKARLPAPR